jgi:hypothetical protein
VVRKGLFDRSSAKLVTKELAEHAQALRAVFALRPYVVDPERAARLRGLFCRVLGARRPRCGWVVKKAAKKTAKKAAKHTEKLARRPVAKVAKKKAAKKPDARAQTGVRGPTRTSARREHHLEVKRRVKRPPVRLRLTEADGRHLFLPRAHKAHKAPRAPLGAPCVPQETESVTNSSHGRRRTFRFADLLDLAALTEKGAR